ncbi:MAG: tRNA (adenosine(37)-N6)-dimethylallyltransferase MiaA, partial [Proteobacteria bacterium]|nr:tRNA (adenosine(37)-N6)-dimethylallyltransferase MiaA [Pseudomonadota bacterium]
MVFLAVVGPTSSGKSDVALMLAQQLGGEIVCCDSVQVYRGFDIGSAKPSRADQAKVPHHLFNILEWHETFDAATYAVKAKECILDIEGRGKIPIVTGGSGLYLRSLISDRWNDDLPNDPALRDMLRMRSSIELYAELRQKDPRRAAEIHVNDRFRVVRALEIVLLTGKPVPQAPESLPGQARHVTIVMEPPRENLLQKIAERTRL